MIAQQTVAASSDCDLGIPPDEAESPFPLGRPHQMSSRDSG
jgi:hypothetical protein